MTSINTNYGASIALQNLSMTNAGLADTQSRISTGLKVANAKDNGAIFAIAEGMRTRVTTITAVKDNIDRTTSAIDTGLAAGSAVSDLMNQMREKAVQAQGAGLSESDRSKLNEDFKALSAQIDQVVNAATFNGTNFVNGSNLASGSNAVKVLVSDTGGASSPFEAKTAASTDKGILSKQGTLKELRNDTTIEADSVVQFSLTSTGDTGTQTQTFRVAVKDADTIEDFLANVSSATNGEVTANYNDETGEITYSANKEFKVEFGEYKSSTFTAKDDTGFLDGTSGEAGTTMTAPSGATAATNTVTMEGADFRRGQGSLATVTSSLSVTSVSNAESAVTALDTALNNIRTDMAKLGSQAKALDVQKNFLGKLSDNLEKGIGAMVDADLAKESARLQSLQIKQQLGAQSLSIANQAPSIVLSLFR